MKRPKNFCNEHYEGVLCSAEPLRGILLPQGDTTSGSLCIKGRAEE
jgi:hypothetical protein